MPRFFKKLWAKWLAFRDAPHPRWWMTSLDGHDWTPTDKSRAEWRRIHYPGDTE